MKIDNKNKRTRLLVAVFAGVAVILLTASLYQQSTTASTKETNNVIIDFNAFPETDAIELAKGDTLVIPIMVESPKDAEYELKLTISPDRSVGTIANETADKPSAEGITAALDKESVAISRQDASITDLGYDRVTRNSGAALTISAATDADDGTYSYVLEARKELPDGRALAAGKIFTVTVK